MKIEVHPRPDYASTEVDIMFPAITISDRPDLFEEIYVELTKFHKKWNRAPSAIVLSPKTWLQWKFLAKQRLAYAADSFWGEYLNLPVICVDTPNDITFQLPDELITSVLYDALNQPPA